MKKVIILTLLFFSTAFAYAQEKKTVSVPENILTQEQKEYLNTNSKIEIASGYLGLGKEIGEGFNGALGALTKHSVEFSQTDLGKFTMVLIAYKVVGTDIIQLFIGSILFIIIIVFGFFYFFRNIITRKVLISDDPEKGKKWETIKSSDGERCEFYVTFIMAIALDMFLMFAG